MRPASPACNKPRTQYPTHHASERRERLLLEALYGDLTGYLALVSSVSSVAPNDSGTAQGNLLGTRAAYFDYPAQTEAALSWAEAQRSLGREVHLCPHLLVARRRLKDNAANVRALWADADEAELPEDFPSPTITVRSSPGRHHLYWSLRRPLAPGAADQLNRRLTHTIGADPGGWALAALLRMPGTNNLKYPEALLVTVTSHDETLRYHPREIEQYLEDEPVSLPRIGELPRPHPDDTVAYLGVENLCLLSPRMRTLIKEGNEAAGKPYKSRSEADFAVAVAMFGRGFAEEAVRDVLSDPSNGISEKYREKGRHGEDYLKRTINNAHGRAEPARPSARTRPIPTKPAERRYESK